MIRFLKQNKANITIVNPYLTDETHVFTEKTVYQALENADVMVLMTAHDEFKTIDFEKVKKMMKIPIVVDGRRIYDPIELREKGFYYRGVGAIK